MDGDSFQFFQMVVVPSALHDGIPCPEGIAPEDDARVVTVGAAHALVKQMYFSARISSVYRKSAPAAAEHDGLGVGSDVPGLGQDLHATEQVTQPGERLFCAPSHLDAVQIFLHAKIIPVINELPHPHL